MSIITPELIRSCKRCGSELAPGALVCGRCHTLVHAEQLDQLASEAKSLEAQGELLQARERWLQGLPLLPPDAKQADWIRDHARVLQSQAQIAVQAPEPENQWGRKLAPLAPLALFLAKAKSFLLIIFKLKFLLSFASFIAVYWALYGMWFGIGFAVLILVHEMGHFIDIRRRGLPADMPMFMPGLGAYVRWQAIGVSLETRAAVSLAGPLAGWFGAAICTLLWFKTGAGVWAALATSTAGLNLLNLVPVWILDGGSATLALSKNERIMLLFSGLAFAWIFGQPLFLFIAAGAVWRLFTKDLPAHSSPKTAAYYLVVLILLGLIFKIAPVQSTGLR